MKSSREEVFTTKIRAGKRTYFFDVHSTRFSDYYITITESKKRMDGKFDKHKIFLYKEDFNKFTATLQEVINYVKVELLPDYDYEEFDRRRELRDQENEESDSLGNDSALSTTFDD
ncbi:MAG: PUR family DNA/RNA-binding protein [Bacteroidia bacterium]|nr:PUR family DNA/RNA-binding protein [Bacteroidia bacterium]